MFYDKFRELCTQRKISVSRAAVDIGLSNSTPTKWKKTGATPDGATLSKVAAYFGVPISDLMDAPTLISTAIDIASSATYGQKEKPTSTAGEQTQNISEKDIRAAFFNGADPTLTEEEMAAMWEDAKTYLHFKLEQRRKQKNDT